jgi:hypothetical protein
VSGVVQTCHHEPDGNTSGTADVSGDRPTTVADPEEMHMSTIEFFEYLSHSEATRELAQQLADAWVSHEVGYVPEQVTAA